MWHSNARRNEYLVFHRACYAIFGVKPFSLRRIRLRQFASPPSSEASTSQCDSVCFWNDGRCRGFVNFITPRSGVAKRIGQQRVCKSHCGRSIGVEMYQGAHA